MMTREEAIYRLASLREHCHSMQPMICDDKKNNAWVQWTATLDYALSALRPVSREKVEKVWRGEWELDKKRSSLHVEKIYLCTRCKNFEAWGEIEKTNFCGHCGAPMTDEAVQMVMERLEALKDGIYR